MGEERGDGEREGKEEEGRVPSDALRAELWRCVGSVGRVQTQSRIRR